MAEKSKFNVSKNTAKRTYNEIVFDSEMEMKYYRDVVCPAVESGDIVDYELQKPYILQPKFTHNDKNIKAITYVADFYVKYKDGREEVIDVKGCPDTVAKIKRKMFWYVYPDITYLWKTLSKIDGGWCNWEYVDEQRKLRKKAKKLIAKTEETI